MITSDHPLRRPAVEEMHLRRFGRVRPPCRLVQMVRLLKSEARIAEAERLERPPGGLSLVQRSVGRYAAGEDENGAQFFWEGHTEATTLTLILPPDEGLEKFAHLIGWMENWPGEVVRATRIKIFTSEEIAKAEIDRTGYREEDLVSCRIKGGVRLWSDFRLGADGYGHLILVAPEISPIELGRIVQRLQELGNYRNLSLIGLPLVKEQIPRLDALEAQLATLAEDVTQTSGSDEQSLDKMSAVSAELANMAATMSFRLGATRAYARIARDRLEALEIEPIPDFQSLSDFTERRLVPAVRTCAVFEDRLTRLADRAAGLAALVHARIDMRIKGQNRDVLGSMERSFALQLHLQHLVEGISILAASYYTLGLIKYILEALPDGVGGVNVDLVLGVLALPLILTFYLGFRGYRSGLEERAGKQDMA